MSSRHVSQFLVRSSLRMVSCFSEGATHAPCHVTIGRASWRTSPRRRHGLRDTVPIRRKRLRSLSSFSGLKARSRRRPKECGTPKISMLSPAVPRSSSAFFRRRRPFLVLEADRDALLAMLEGEATLCMLVVSGNVWVSDWRRALLFQESFVFDAEAFARWRESQRTLMLRTRHTPRRRVLVGGENLDESVEAAIQSVLESRGAAPRPYSLCCLSRK